MIIVNMISVYVSCICGMNVWCVWKHLMPVKKKNLMPSGDTSYGPNSDKWHGAASM